MPGSLSTAPAGLTGGYNGSSLPTNIAMIVLYTIALYNSVELIILIFVTFNRYSGLYFWALLLSSVLGVIPHSVGYLLNFNNAAPRWLVITISTIGYYFMVPGQSVVLYSRLHLVLQDAKSLRRVRWLIIIASLVVIIPTTVMTYGTVFVRTSGFIHGYNVVERFQLTWFCVQEFFISGLYIYETIKLLRLSPEKSTRRRKIMYELIAINVVIILMDIALMVLEYLNYYILQVTLKSAVYSMKLKLEFSVLGKLVSLVQIHRSDGPSSTDDGSIPNFVNPEQLTTDVTHAIPAHGSRNLRSRLPAWALSMDSLPISEQRTRTSRSVEIPRNANP